MNEERIKEIFADEEFVKELFSKETLAGVAGGVLPVLAAVAIVMGAAYIAIGGVAIAKKVTGRW